MVYCSSSERLQFNAVLSFGCLTLGKKGDLGIKEGVQLEVVVCGFCRPALSVLEVIGLRV